RRAARELRRRFRVPGRHRQLDREGRADAELALDANASAALLDGRLHDREPEAGAALALRREERLEDAPPHARMDPTARVADGQPHGPLARALRDDLEAAAGR